eukprot:2000749-Pleurochrysis_carterae.AAC.2
MKQPPTPVPTGSRHRYRSLSSMARAHRKILAYKRAHVGCRQCRVLAEHACRVRHVRPCRVARVNARLQADVLSREVDVAGCSPHGARRAAAETNRKRRMRHLRLQQSHAEEAARKAA